MEWGKQQLVRFLLGHMAVSQVAGVLARKVGLCAAFPLMPASLPFERKES